MKREAFRFFSKKVLVIVAISIFFGLALHQKAMARGDVPGSFADLADKVGNVAVNISSTKVVKPMGR